MVVTKLQVLISDICNGGDRTSGSDIIIS